MNFHKYIKIGMTVGCCIIISACGYHFLGAGTFPADVKKIHVNILSNSTSETGAENVFTNALRYEFIRHKKNAGQNDADGFLFGDIRALSYETITHRRRHISVESRVTVVVALELKDREGNTIWTQNVSAREEYDVTPDKLSNEQNRKRAISKLSERLAENAYNRLTDNF